MVKVAGISKIVNVTAVPDDGVGSVAFPYQEYLSDPIRTVPAVEVVKFQNVEVAGVRLQIAISSKTPTIAVRNVGEVVGP